MNMKFEKFKTKDFVLLGILLAFYIVLYMASMMIVSIVAPGLSYIIAIPIFAIFDGVVITFLLYKMPKNWVLTIFSLLFMLVFTFLGMSYIPWFVAVIVGAVLADIIAMTSTYKSKFKNAVAYGLINAGNAAGMVIPIWISAEYYKSQVATKGATEQMMQLALDASTGFMGVFTLALAFLGAFLGIYLGYAVLAKHFNKQER